MTTFIQLGTDTNWVSASIGNSLRAGIKSDGTLWVWGSSTYGGLGRGTTVDSSELPVKLGVDTDWHDISVGENYMVAVKTNGSLWSWGRNLTSELGTNVQPNGYPILSNVPVQVDSGSTWKMVKATFNSLPVTVGIKSDNTVWAWGSTINDRLGYNYNIWYTSSFDEWVSLPTQVTGFISASDIAIGSNSVLIMESQGTGSAVYEGGNVGLPFDDNYKGQLTETYISSSGKIAEMGSPYQVLNDTDLLTATVTLKPIGNETFILSDDGVLEAWGKNQFGQLGLGDTTAQPEPVFITSKLAPTGSSKIATGNAFKAHTAIIKQDGTLWTAGYNKEGQLGLGHTTNTNILTKVGTDANWNDVSTGPSHSMAVKTDGTLWVWGYNHYGIFGVSSSALNSSNIPVQIGTDTDWTRIFTGTYHCFGLKVNGSLWGWGKNDQGQLGVGDRSDKYEPVQLAGGNNWTHVTTVEDYTIAQQVDGTIWAWGKNDEGQLALANSSASVNIVSPEPHPNGWEYVIGKVETSANATLAIRVNTGSATGTGTLWGWGKNNSNILGLSVNNTGKVIEPTQIGTATDWVSIGIGGSTAVGARFTPPTTTTTTLPPFITTTTLPPGSTTTTTTAPPSGSGSVGITYLSAGGYSYYVIKDGNLWAWGYNGEGSLGLGDTTDRALPTQVAGSWKSVAAGEYSTLAIKSDGSLWGTGYNNHGELGLGDTVQRNTMTLVDSGVWSTVEMSTRDLYATSVAIKSDGTLWYAGTSSSLASATPMLTFTQIGSDTNWVSASVGLINSLAIKSNGTLWGWGDNNYGELGLSPHTYQGPAGPTLEENYVLIPTQIGAYTDWIKIAAGVAATAGIRSNGTLWTTGYNAWGMLGIGDSRVGFTYGVNDYIVETFTQVGSDTDWVDVRAGYYYFIARKSNGTIWAWGRNDSGELGLGTIIPEYYNVPTQIGSATDWTMLDTGAFDSLAVKNNELAFGGANMYDYVGTGNTPQVFAVLPYSIP